MLLVGVAVVVVACVVGARGFHVDGVECVLHFDPPEDGKAYVHRSGRTARAGASGTVVCFVDKSQRKAVKHIQREAGIDVQVVDPDLDRFGDVQPLKSKPLKADSGSKNSSRPQGRKPSGGQNRNKQGKGKRKTHNGNDTRRNNHDHTPGRKSKPAGKGGVKAKSGKRTPASGNKRKPCLLYTTDAADE